MIIASNIVAICWIIFILYWGINWWRVKPAKETAWRAQWYRLWIVILLLLIFPIGKLSAFWQSSIPVFLFLESPVFQIIGILFTVIGLCIALIARKTLADNWSGNIELKENHKLITYGIYKYMRHPIYTGILLMGLGSFLVIHSIIMLSFFIGMIVFCFFKLKKEEELLNKHFHKEYLAYMKRTKALIPFVY